MRLATTGKDLTDSVGGKIGELSELIKTGLDNESAGYKSIDTTVLNSLLENMRAASQPLSNAKTEITDKINSKLTEVNEALKTASQQVTENSKDMFTTISQNMDELSSMLKNVVSDTSSGPETN